jgi:hypothetical protein
LFLKINPALLETAISIFNAKANLEE